MPKHPSGHKNRANRSPQSLPPAPAIAWTAHRLLESPAGHLLFLTLVAIAAYANTFQAPFVFDDNSSIVNNPVIKELSTFLSSNGYAYNPRRFVGYLTFALNYRFGGLDTTGYHVANLAIHILTAWLVYDLVRLTFTTAMFRASDPLLPQAWLIPLLAALLFVAHPVQTQAVTYIVQRLASLATLFYLLAMVMYVRGRLAWEAREGTGLHNAPFAFFVLALVAAILAMRTKEIAATLPLTVVLYEFSFFRASPRKKLVFLAPLLATILIIPLGMLHSGKPLGELLSDVSEMARETQTISRGDYLLTQFSVIVTYIRLLFFPVNQTLDYDYPVYHSLFAPRVLASLLLLLSLFLLALLLYHRSARDRSPLTAPVSRLIAFGILWFFITLSVESSIIPITDVIFEHRLYLPSVGAFIAMAAGAVLILGRRHARALIAGGILLTVLLSAATWRRNLVWGDTTALWTDIVEKAPGKFRPHNNLGKFYLDKGMYDEAIPHFKAALKAKPDYFDARNNLGVAYGMKGDVDKAIESLQAAAQLKPAEAGPHLNLANAYALKGLAQKAAEEKELAQKLGKDTPQGG